MPVPDESIAALLRGQASLQPDAPAFTSIDYELDPAGFTETLTWSQAHQRVQAFAAEIASYGNAGDRVAILARKIRRSACAERYLQEEFDSPGRVGGVATSHQVEGIVS